jgi:hypothetical protein
MDDDKARGEPEEQFAERRRLPRSKRVLFSGVIVDLAGKAVLDCTIRDLSVDGAQVAVAKQLSANSEVYVVDAHNRAAHRARVVWSASDRAGLSFLATIDLSRELPPQLDFLKRVLLETKLRQIMKLTRQGVSSETAKAMVGLDKEEQLTLF